MEWRSLHGFACELAENSPGSRLLLVAGGAQQPRPPPLMSRVSVKSLVAPAAGLDTALLVPMGSSSDGTTIDSVKRAAGVMPPQLQLLLVHLLLLPQVVMAPVQRGSFLAVPVVAAVALAEGLAYASARRSPVATLPTMMLVSSLLHLQPGTIAASLVEMPGLNPWHLVLPVPPAPPTSSAGGPSCEPTKESPTSLFPPRSATTEPSLDGPAVASASRSRRGDRRQLLPLLLPTRMADAPAVV